MEHRHSFHITPARLVCSIKIADLHSNCSPDWSDDSFDTSSAQTGVIPIKRASRYAVACCNRRKVNFAHLRRYLNGTVYAATNGDMSAHQEKDPF